VGHHGPGNPEVSEDDAAGILGSSERDLLSLTWAGRCGEDAEGGPCLKPGLELGGSYGVWRGRCGRCRAGGGEVCAVAEGVEDEELRLGEALEKDAIVLPMDEQPSGAGGYVAGNGASQGMGE
jgi:hypothetical protein